MSYQPFGNPAPVSQSGAWSISFSSAQAVTQSGTWNIGSITTLPALPTGSNTIGGVNLTQYTPVTGRLPVDGSGVTQPVSISGSVPVTGTFWQATQPVSGTVGISGSVAVTGPLTDTQLRATAVPVSGTFWQATQPVSLATLPALTAGSANIGSVKITDGTNTITLDQNSTDGEAATEWTVPVESYNMVFNGTTWDRARGDTTNGAWVNIKASATLPVSGTFWQATQPVSIATAVPITDNAGSLTVDAPVATPVFVRLSDGTAAIATLPVSLATVPALVAGTALIGKVGIDQTTVGTTNAVSLAQLGANTVLTGVGAAGTGSLRVTISSDAVSAAAALADALANPTLGQQAVLNSVFNGTTWDRQRGMGGNLTTGDTGAKTATGNGATITNVGNKGVSIVVNMGAVTGTTPTCVLKVQGSADGGTTWYDIPGATTASLTATGVFGITVYPGIAVTAGTTTTGTAATANMPLPRTWRMVWTIGGTTPSFTITNIQYNYLPN